jgi:hypothetical protein
MIKGWVVTEGYDSIIEVEANDVRGLVSQLLALGRNDRRSKHQPFERAQTNAIRESDQIKLPEQISFTLVDAVTKTVSKKWVASQALGLLNQ